MFDLATLIIGKFFSISLTYVLKPPVCGFFWLSRRIVLFLVRGTWDLTCDLLRPQPWKSRPWGVVLVATTLACLAIYFYQQVLHSYQVSIWKWIYVNTKIVALWPPDKFDFLKLPVKTVWFGDIVIVLMSFGLMNRIWQQKKRHIESKKGLEHFSQWTVEAIDSHTKSISIATNTPLIHIFYDNPDVPALSAYGGESTFEDKFCYPFKDALSTCRRSVKNLQFLYVAPEVLGQTSPWLPISADDDFETYINGISAFQQEVITSYATGIDTSQKKDDRINSVFRKATMIPLWISVITRTGSLGRRPENAVILGLTNRRDLTKSLHESAGNVEKKQMAAEIAKDVMCLRSTDPDIVKFFTGVFQSLWDEENRNFDFIFSLLHRARRGHEIEVLLREPYDRALHADWVPGSPDHIIYTTKPKPQ